jgi:hypothetical protein
VVIEGDGGIHILILRRLEGNGTGFRTRLFMGDKKFVRAAAA